ncbi:hypothetical protein [Thalassotalea sediminis]|uniref:hypothetical protein n=1 Tax=Thalassotalea sediminis TaxID=1759089 RepID=UPI002572FE15|nr:hypothetical protein [Thalassotalea sediminis]
MKSTPPKLVSLVLASMLSTVTLADEPLSKFKVAVIKNTAGSSELVNGNYTSGLNKLKHAQKSSHHFEIDMGLCAANLKRYKFDQAEEACSKAINNIDTHAARSREGKFIKALALSNRGIVRYLQNNNFGALDDFTSALLLSDSRVIKDNLAYFKSTMHARTLGSETLEVTE